MTLNKTRRIRLIWAGLALMIAGLLSGCGGHDCNDLNVDLVPGCTVGNDNNTNQFQGGGNSG